MADRADFPTSVIRLDRVRSILDDHQVVALSDVHERLHGTRAAIQVDRNDRPCSRCDGCLDTFRIDQARTTAAIRQYRHGPSVDDGVSRGHEGHRGGDDLRPRADAGRDQAEMKRSGAGIDCNRVLRASVSAKQVREPGGLGPVPSQPERNESTTSPISASSMKGAPKTRRRAAYRPSTPSFVIRAGTPITWTLSGTSFVTSDPAPIIDPLPIFR
jgi:hypothetical protein